MSERSSDRQGAGEGAARPGAGPGRCREPSWRSPCGSLLGETPTLDAATFAELYPPPGPRRRCTGSATAGAAADHVIRLDADGLIAQAEEADAAGRGSS
ncbi:MAG TPA: hypothetical protein VIL48_03745 [Acidimicrobiales bacterium]